MTPATVTYQGQPHAVVGEGLQFGLLTRTLLGLPRRAYTPDELVTAPALFISFADVRKTTPLLNPAEAAIARAGTSWLASTRRAQASLLAWFILAEDPQRRLDAREVAPLLHQRSLVEHVLNSADLRRVLIADEVGLGKTVEAGMILQRLLNQGAARALYLAPARLVRNVISEFTRLGLDARGWTAADSNARLDRDRLVVASIQKSVFERNADALVAAGPWDIIVADECHHLSDWAEGGGSPNAGYRLLNRLIAGQRSETGRVMLMSGTPHQGHQARFENLLALLQRPERRRRTLLDGSYSEPRKWSPIGTVGRCFRTATSRRQRWSDWEPTGPSGTMRLRPFTQLARPLQRVAGQEAGPEVKPCSGSLQASARVSDSCAAWRSGGLAGLLSSQILPRHLRHCVPIAAALQTSLCRRSTNA